VRTGFEIREGSQMLAERFVKLSQNDRILAVLQDGRDHSVPEIHRIAGTCRLNSRIAELRKRGHAITCFRIPNQTGAASYGYRLDVSGDSSGSLPSLGRTAEVAAVDAPPPSSTSPLQLSMDAA